MSREIRSLRVLLQWMLPQSRGDRCHGDVGIEASCTNLECFEDLRQWESKAHLGTVAVEIQHTETIVVRFCPVARLKHPLGAAVGVPDS